MIKTSMRTDVLPLKEKVTPSTSSGAMPFQFEQFAEFMEQRGLILINANADCSKSGKELNTEEEISPGKSDNEASSIVTIYKHAVNPEIRNNQSSSDEEMQFNTSDDSGNVPMEVSVQDFDQFHNFVDGRRDSGQARPQAERQQDERDQQEQMPRTPMQGGGNARITTPGAPGVPQFTRGEIMVREAEKGRARIYDVKGKEQSFDNNAEMTTHPYSSSLDKDYLMIGNHVEEGIKRKILNGEYVDFAKLMPRDKITFEEDQRMEMVNKGGMSYWVPLAERETTTINSFHRWEQAFRVFTNIYVNAFPRKSAELVQYNHIIHTAAQTFTWENVYRYDREFHLHMSKHHLVRSWSVILQQAWAMCLKDRVTSSSPHGGNHGGNGGNSRGNHSGVRCKLCFDFNAGNCTFGHRCKFDHRCSFCNKFGHGVFNCRRARNGGSNPQQHGQNQNFNNNAGTQQSQDKSRGVSHK